mmetsp:Transcript_38486/g.80842  ORF Transcript_38486/g.80842 Transcript_38486/m.80842 type:complete len:263 (+) Transcript_38486:699-1487(+)
MPQSSQLLFRPCRTRLPRRPLTSTSIAATGRRTGNARRTLHTCWPSARPRVRGPARSRNQRLSRRAFTRQRHQVAPSRITTSTVPSGRPTASARRTRALCSSSAQHPARARSPRPRQPTRRWASRRRRTCTRTALRGSRTASATAIRPSCSSSAAHRASALPSPTRTSCRTPPTAASTLPCRVGASRTHTRRVRSAARRATSSAFAATRPTRSSVRRRCAARPSRTSTPAANAAPRKGSAARSRRRCCATASSRARSRTCKG